MTNQFLNSTREFQPKKIIEKKETALRNWTLLHLAAGIGLLGGTFLLFAAVFLTIFEYFYSENPHGNWLFLAVLPLWVMGAVCLDKVEDAEKAERIAYCKRTGIKDKDCTGNQYIN